MRRINANRGFVWRSTFVLGGAALAASLSSPALRAAQDAAAQAGAPQPATISGIHIVGQPVLMFDHLVDKREDNHIPDLPTTAWKEADGTVNVTVPHIENYRLRGPDLESAVSDPNKIFSSTSSASDIVESHYNYHHWLAAPYTFDGRTIYALAHTEWYACLIGNDCGFGPANQYSTGNFWLNSWANTVTSMVSADGGTSWAMNGLNGAHVVSNESFTWTGSDAFAQRIYLQATNHSGLMSPSRLVREGAYYYTIGFLNHRNFNNIDPTTHVAPIDKYDWVLMRTTDPRQPAGWEGWVSGSQYAPMSSHGFSAFSPMSNGGGMNAGEPQIIFDTNSNLYIAIFVVWGNPGSVYYTTTPSLAQPVWSSAVAIGGSSTLQTNPRNPQPCSLGFVVNDYVSIADSHSDGFNFELTDGDPWLEYVFNPANTCGGDNLARDLYRVKLIIDYAPTARPSFASQPGSQRVATGRSAQFTATTTGNPLYQWQESTDNGVTWFNLTEGIETFTGTTTPILSVVRATAPFTRTRYRCIATDGSVHAMSNAAILTVTQPIATDFDADGKTDLAIWRPTTGEWWVRRSSSGYTNFQGTQWGLPGDVPLRGDFNGDGVADVAIWRPSTGEWWLQPSSGNMSVRVYQWGLPGDIPVPGDFDGDGTTDLAVWRPSTGTWWIRYSSHAYDLVPVGQFQWGLAGDVPMVGDFDGDGVADLAVWRPSTGTWWIRYSSQFYSTAVVGQFQWGLTGDVPLMGDFDGDGVTDLAVWRPSTGTWWIRYSTHGYDIAAPGQFQWGLPGDVPLATDLDGDGRIDLTIYRPATGEWWVRLSSTGYSIANYVFYQWGLPGDTVVK